MQIAVGDVAPDRGVQPPPHELVIVHDHQLLEPLERDDHIGRGFRNLGVDRLLGSTDPSVDRRRHCLPHAEQLYEIYLKERAEEESGR